jgi:hypothetical protein
MKLEPLMTYHADLKAPVDVGKGPIGQRMIFDVTGGTVDGPRVSGKLLASGADWLLVDESGIARLDVRITLETHDGARIYIHYHGILEMNEKVSAAMTKGEGLDYGDTYFMTSGACSPTRSSTASSRSSTTPETMRPAGRSRQSER